MRNKLIELFLKSCCLVIQIRTLILIEIVTKYLTNTLLVDINLLSNLACPGDVVGNSGEVSQASQNIALG
jgi:hypothetical protein